MVVKRGRWLAPALAGVVLLADPAWSQNADIDRITQGVLSGCKLEGWQFALRKRQDNSYNAELSPTLSSDQSTCVYQVLQTWDVPLDAQAVADQQPKN